MGKMNEIAILIGEFAREYPKLFDYLETLSERDFKEHPAAKRLAKDLGISMELLSDNFMHDVE